MFLRKEKTGTENGPAFCWDRRTDSAINTHTALQVIFAAMSFFGGNTL